MYNGTTYGSIATYICEDGMHLDGETDIFCIENGKWQSPPSCSGKLNTSVTTTKDESFTATPIEHKNYDGTNLMAAIKNNTYHGIQCFYT